jgi:hypothetical protein
LQAHQSGNFAIACARIVEFAARTNLNSEPKVFRRPLKSRDTKWAATLARRVANVGVRPNAISIENRFFAALI